MVANPGHDAEQRFVNKLNMYCILCVVCVHLYKNHETDCSYMS